VLLLAISWCHGRRSLDQLARSAALHQRGVARGTHSGWRGRLSHSTVRRTSQAFQVRTRVCAETGLYRAHRGDGQRNSTNFNSVRSASVSEWAFLSLHVISILAPPARSLGMRARAVQCPSARPLQCSPRRRTLERADEPRIDI
jgi:hypothetical protein